MPQVNYAWVDAVNRKCALHTADDKGLMSCTVRAIF